MTYIIGLTATPSGAKGEGLGGLWDDMVRCVPLSQLIQEEHLVPTRVFAPFRPKLKKGRLLRGGYSEADLEKVMDRGALVGDPIGTWRDRCPDRPTVVYCVSKRHGRHVKAQFQAAGIRSGFVCDDTDDSERRDLMGWVDDWGVMHDGMITDGRIKVLVNVLVMKRGTDIPALSCMINLRPFGTLRAFRQAVGRIRRPHKDKTDAILLDHSGSVFIHGHPDNDIEWQLCSKDTNIESKIREKLEQAGAMSFSKCWRCSAMFEAKLSVCPECGAECKRDKKQTDLPEAEDGELLQIDKQKQLLTDEEKKKWWKKYLMICWHTDKPYFHARGMYKGKVGCYPEEDGITYRIAPRSVYGMSVRKIYPHIREDKKGLQQKWE